MPAHFQKSIGKLVALRLRDIVDAEGQRSERRLQGVLTAADEQTVTIRLDDADADRANRAVRQDRSRQDRVPLGPRPQARPRARPQEVPDERSRHVRSGPDAGQGEEHLGRHAAARAGRRLGDCLQAPARRRRRGRWSRSTRTRWSSPSSPTTSTRTATGSTSATTRRRRKSSAASPPRRSAR